MGLDMYLFKHVYVGADYEHRKVEGKIELTSNGKPIDVNLSRVSEIIEKVGYWRKANAIHKWFVDNVQEGEDDCGTYYVDDEKMRELLDICKRVIASTELIEGIVTNGFTSKDAPPGEMLPILEKGKTIADSSVAEELLPTQKGFFFGSNDYDEYYVQDIRDTIKILETCLKDEGGDYYYHSSW